MIAAIAGIGDVVPSLRDLNFEIEQAKVAIIRRTEAGKSTLFKIRRRVTWPPIGTVKAPGRITSLLEVGAELPPELTGREDIFLNIAGPFRTTFRFSFPTKIAANSL